MPEVAEDDIIKKYFIYSKQPFNKKETKYKQLFSN